MRVFKTKWFSKMAKNHAIKDDELCLAINAVSDNLGGGVYKKRLSHNRDRAIILAKGGKNWFYTFLYAKQDMPNITHEELSGFRVLAKHYACLKHEKLSLLIDAKELLEICHDRKREI